jgi:glucan phosphoethanolaminetransferase (alkaline phosphatase superfamily)
MSDFDTNENVGNPVYYEEKHLDLNKNTEQKETSPVISFGEWIWSCLLMFIPAVGLVFSIIWIVNRDENPTKRNFAKAVLTIKAILAIFCVIFYILFAIIYAAMLISALG